jgi:hypothetical protein
MGPRVAATCQPDKARKRLVTPMRFELMASGLGILRSILLSYGVGGRNLNEGP